MTFGEKLQKLRKAKGWTQEELASQVSVSRQALSKWEKGSVLPDTDNILRISKIFEVSTDYLLHEDFESDADIPAVHASKEELSKEYQSKARAIIGTCISCIGLIGFVVIYILSLYFPTDSRFYVDGVLDHYYDGFLGFVIEHRLEWLVVLCAIATISGLIVIFSSQIALAAKRIKAKLIHQ